LKYIIHETIIQYTDYIYIYTVGNFRLETVREKSSEKLRQFVDKLFGYIKALEAIGHSPMA